MSGGSNNEGVGMRADVAACLAISRLRLKEVTFFKDEDDY